MLWECGEGRRRQWRIIVGERGRDERCSCSIIFFKLCLFFAFGFVLFFVHLFGDRARYTNIEMVDEEEEGGVCGGEGQPTTKRK